MSAARKSSGASERLGRREKILLSIIFTLCKGEPKPLSYSKIENALENRFLPRPNTWMDIAKNRKEMYEYKRSLLRSLIRRRYVRFFTERFAGINLRTLSKQYRFITVTEKGVEAGRQAARELLKREVVEMAVRRLRAQGAMWVTIQDIMDKVWEVTKEKNLFANRKEFEEYWTKRKLALILKRLNIKSKRKQENGERRWGYAL